MFGSKSVHPTSGISSGIDPGRSIQVSGLGSVLPGLAKIKTEFKELKNQLTIVHFSPVNEVRHSEQATPTISSPFEHKYPLQNPKNKIPFSLHEIKIQKEV